MARSPKNKNLTEGSIPATEEVAATGTEVSKAESTESIGLQQKILCVMINANKHITRFMVRFEKQFSRYLINVGAHVTTLISMIVLYTLLYTKKLGQLLASLTSMPRKWIGCGAGKLVKLLLHPFQKAHAAISGLKDQVSAAKSERGMSAAVGTCVSTIGKGCWRGRGALVTVFNYAAPLICIVFLFNVVAYATNLPYAVKVECNGEALGYIAKESDYQAAEKIMQQRIVYVAGNKTVETKPTFKVEQINGDKVMSAEELADLLISHTDKDIKQAYGLYVDGTFMGALVDKTPVETTLQGLLDKYKAEYSDAEVSFVKNVTYTPGMYLADSIIDTNEIVSLFTSQKQVDVYYTVVEGDTPTGIAEKNNMPYADLKAINPGIEESLLIGQQVLLNKAQPYMSVQIKRVEHYDEILDYETEKTEDATKYKGVETIKQKGAEGKAAVTAEVTYVDGHETARNVTDRQVITAPVTLKVSVGTKTPKPSQSVSTASAGDGMFIWPVGGGYISAGWGDGRGHKGVDIAAPRGTPIYAAASGTVKLSQTYSGYGKAVIIDHGNGVQTVYGHCSALYVTVGQHVTQGDMIAAVGRTGQSTGNHCHFEVRVNGSPRNPNSYCSWY